MSPFSYLPTTPLSRLTLSLLTLSPYLKDSVSNQPASRGHQPATQGPQRSHRHLCVQDHPGSYQSHQGQPLVTKQRVEAENAERQRMEENIKKVIKPRKVVAFLILLHRSSQVRRIRPLMHQPMMRLKRTLVTSLIRAPGRWLRINHLLPSPCLTANTTDN